MEDLLTEYKTPQANRDAVRKRRMERMDFVSAYKLEKGCLDCGYNEYAIALQFDHVRGEKVGNISDLLTSTWDILLEEINKCEVVCANCHHVRTMTERGMTLQKRSLN